MPKLRASSGADDGTIIVKGEALATERGLWIFNIHIEILCVISGMTALSLQHKGLKQGIPYFLAVKLKA